MDPGKSASSKASVNTPAIVGGTIGGVLLGGALVGGAVLYYFKYHAGRSAEFKPLLMASK